MANLPQFTPTKLSSYTVVIFTNSFDGELPAITVVVVAGVNEPININTMRNQALLILEQLYRIVKNFGSKKNFGEFGE